MPCIGGSAAGMEEVGQVKGDKERGGVYSGRGRVARAISAAIGVAIGVAKATRVNTPPPKRLSGGKEGGREAVIEKQITALEAVIGICGVVGRATACDCGVAGSIPTSGALEVWP